MNHNLTIQKQLTFRRLSFELCPVFENIDLCKISISCPIQRFSSPFKSNYGKFDSQWVVLLIHQLPLDGFCRMMAHIILIMSCTFNLWAESRNKGMVTDIMGQPLYDHFSSFNENFIKWRDSLLAPFYNRKLFHHLKDYIKPKLLNTRDRWHHPL